MANYINLTNNLIPNKNPILVSTNSSPISDPNTGKTIICSGSSAITLTDGGAPTRPYLSMGFQIQTTSNALVTIDPTGNLQGQASIAFGTGDSGKIYTDGTTWYLNDVFLQPANFRAYRSTSATLPATGSSLTVLFDTKVRDIGSFYATGTGIWTPLLPGVGLSGGQVIVDFDGSENTIITLQLQKNGSAISTDIQQGVAGNGRKIKLSAFDGDINFNGSTDNYKLVISQTGANTQTILGTIDQTFFFGARNGLF